MSERYTLHLGDNLEALRSMPDNSIDAIVTDPPYGLSFMGKKWDYDVPSVDTWRECLRVLKPGGHLLAFAGTRTQHRMAVNIEDAGFEIRDMIAWVYGSGFPKSHDVSKAIDRMDASEEQQQRRLRFTAWVRSQGVTANQIDKATGTNMGSHYTTASSQPAIMTREHLEACRHLFNNVSKWVEEQCDIRTIESRNYAEREVVGQRTTGIGTGKGSTPIMGDGNRDVTAPATEEAQKWQGWGTALKPAMEPITVARKPLRGTVASNVLEYGTGGLNIGGCRVATDEQWNGYQLENDGKSVNAYGDGLNHRRSESHPHGRWPANLIHDGSEEVMELLDSAARFFYCAKASNTDRNEGLDGFQAVRTGGMQATADGSMLTGSGNKRTTTRANHHPTVKPTDLMRYLCRLVTPPGGFILDPYMGSGSTGKAAMLEGFRFVGCEMEPEYMEIARARIAHAASQVVQEELL